MEEVKKKRKQSPETIEKRRQKMLGHSVSEETRRKISESQIGKIIPEDVKEKIRIARARQIMKPMSEETKRKIGEKNRGKKYGPMSLEAKEHLRKLNSGANGTGWKGGITEANRIFRRSLGYREWRRKCMERDWFRCKISGYKGKDIVVHHIENFADKQELRFDVNNGITLRHDVHVEFHNKYGRGKNTREQLDQFIKDYVSTNNTTTSRGTIQDTGEETRREGEDTAAGTRVESPVPC